MPEIIKTSVDLAPLFAEAKTRGEGFVKVDGHTIVRAPYGGHAIVMSDREKELAHNLTVVDPYAHIFVS